MVVPENMKSRIKTGIQGLDEELGGGIPEGHVILLSGAPGTMKSSIALNIIYNNGVKEGKNGLYISLEQSRASLIEQGLSFGMDFNQIESKVRIIDMGYLRKHMKETQEVSWLDVYKMYAENLKSSLKYDILVTDSLSVLDMFIGEGNRRMKLFELFEWMKGLGCTAFIIAEATTKSGISEEDYLSDGIIRLSKEKIGGMEMQRLVYIDKMREVKHNMAVFNMLFEDGKFQITKAIV
jgi:KaiC/GvpD/RAD55 family RecA-like ATPase